jgi:alcohol dehydrogenase (cytochrome c)
VIATDKETGKIVWDKNLNDKTDMSLNAAPLALKDSILVGASGGDGGIRNWLVSLDPKTGNEQWRTYSIPGPGEPGHETWKDRNNAWQTGGGAYVTGSTIPRPTSPLGRGQPVAEIRFIVSAGRQPLYQRALAIDATTGKIKWHHQYRPTTRWTTTRSARTS